MGREFRKVSKDWVHPKDENGNHVGLFGGSYSKYLEEYNLEKKQWKAGFYRLFKDEQFKPKLDHHKRLKYVEWAGELREPSEFMPDWKENELTHIQLYKTTSEGTPLSPVFLIEDTESILKYISENNIKWFANIETSIEDWKTLLENCTNNEM